MKERKLHFALRYVSLLEYLKSHMAKSILLFLLGEKNEQTDVYLDVGTLSQCQAQW